MARKLVIAQPFDLALTLEMGQTFRWRRVGDENVRARDWGNPPEQWRTGGAWYSGVLGAHLVHIRQSGDGVEYRVGGTDGELHDVDLSEALHDYLRLDDNIAAIHDALRRDPVVARAVELYSGLRLLRQEPWECLVSYACSRTKTIRGTRKSVELVAELSGDVVMLDDDCRAVFPRAELLADQASATLSTLRLGLDKADTILRLARWLAGDPHGLRRMSEAFVSTEDAVGRLDGFRGVGPKIAGCVALMSLDKLDAFPVDRWVQRALAQCDLSEMSPGLAGKVRSARALTGPQQYRIAEWARVRFGPYAGYAGQYLFHGVEPRKERRVAGAATGRSASPDAARESGG